MDVKNTNREFVFLIDSFFLIKEKNVLWIRALGSQPCTQGGQRQNLAWTCCLTESCSAWRPECSFFPFGDNDIGTGVTSMQNLGLNIYTRIFLWDMTNYIWLGIRNGGLMPCSLLFRQLRISFLNLFFLKSKIERVERLETNEWSLTAAVLDSCKLQPSKHTPSPQSPPSWSYVKQKVFSASRECLKPCEVGP